MSGQRSFNALTALQKLETARNVLKSSPDNPALINDHAKQLGFALGNKRMEASGVRAINAVLDRLDNDEFHRDEDAWNEWSASESTFKKWKKRVLEVLLAYLDQHVIDSMSGQELEDLALVGARSRPQGELRKYQRMHAVPTAPGHPPLPNATLLGSSHPTPSHPSPSHHITSATSHHITSRVERGASAPCRRSSACIRSSNGSLTHCEG